MSGVDLAYFAADTLGVTLYSTKGVLVGSEVRQFRLGPWRYELKVDVTSDILGATELGLWMTVGTARLYTIVKEKENWLFVLDEAKLKKCEKTGFQALSVKGRVQEIRPSIQAVFRWKGSSWEQMQFGGEN